MFTSICFILLKLRPIRFDNSSDFIFSVLIAAWSLIWFQQLKHIIWKHYKHLGFFSKAAFNSKPESRDWFECRHVANHVYQVILCPQPFRLCSCTLKNGHRILVALIYANKIRDSWKGKTSATSRWSSGSIKSPVIMKNRKNTKRLCLQSNGFCTDQRRSNNAVCLVLYRVLRKNIVTFNSKYAVENK